MTANMKKNLGEEVIGLEELAGELGITLKTLKVVIQENVREVLVTLNQEEQEKILKAINQIPEGDIKKLSDAEGLYSLKVDDFRMIYSVGKEVITVVLLKRES